jgi:uncharacterized RDD family membrane protein YckC
MEIVKIKTTQNVDLEYEIASVGDRIVAALIDYLVILAYVITTAILATIFISHIRVIGETYVVIFFVLLYLPVFLYDLVSEILLNGQSIGKLSRDIKVIKLDGSQPTMGSYLLRWLFRIIDISLSYGGIAILTILLNGKGQRIGDIAAGTTVIRLRKTISIQDTIFKKVNENHTGTFPEVENLSNVDIEIIKDVLKESIEHTDAKLRNTLLLKTQAAILKKLQINSTMSPRAFLETVVKDYNFYKGKANL